MLKHDFLELLKIANKEPLNFECSEESSLEILKYISENGNKVYVGSVLEDDSLYGFLSVISFLKFIASLYKHHQFIDEAVNLMRLQDVLHIKIRKLTYSQRKRVVFAREIIKDCHMLFLQEPLLNLDDESMRIILSWLEKAQQNKNIICTSVSLKHVCLLAGKHYHIENGIFKQIHDQGNMEPDIAESTFDKISVRYENNILLFHPHEIEYIESIQGKSYINVRNDAFQCSSTMDELESKLKRFGFYRCHRSYLVNMQKVKEIVRWTRNSYSLKLEGTENVNIPLSKGRVDELKDLYEK